jgi:threonine dehydrogenase-like Zn-dependent dehydrogenase
LFSTNDVRIDEVPRRNGGLGGNLIRVTRNRICRSNLQVIHGIPGALNQPMPLRHEFVGIVEVLGNGVSTFAVSDSVCVKPNTSCAHFGRARPV